MTFFLIDPQWWMQNAEWFFGLVFKPVIKWILEKIGLKKKTVQPLPQQLSTAPKEQSEHKAATITTSSDKVINVTIENSPNARVEIYAERPDKQKAKEIHKDENVWLTRVDQIEPYKSGIIISEPFEKIENKLTSYISKSDLDILTTSFAILKQEKDNPKYSRYLYGLMADKFEERSKRIFKRLRDGSFEKVLLPFVEDIEKLKTINIKETFSDFYETFLKDTTDRVWIKNLIPEKIINEISEKMKKYDKISVYVAGDAKKIYEADKLCREFVSQKGYSITPLETTYLHEKGKIFIISKK